MLGPQKKNVCKLFIRLFSHFNPFLNVSKPHGQTKKACLDLKLKGERETDMHRNNNNDKNRNTFKSVT